MSHWTAPFLTLVLGFCVGWLRGRRAARIELATAFLNAAQAAVKDAETETDDESA